MNDSSHLDFVLTDPLDVGSTLNELLRNAERLHAARGGEPHAVYLAGVDLRSRTFRFRPYGGDEAWNTLKAAAELEFNGAANGAQIDFRIGASRVVSAADDDGIERPVLEADFPAQLRRMQRREFFRAPVAPPNTRVAVWRTPAGGDLRMRIQDISLAGVGLRTPMAATALPRQGDEMNQVVLDFNEHGTLKVDLRVITVHVDSEYDVRQGHVEYSHLGCEFIEPQASRDAFLQKLVYQLELAHRANR